MRFLSLLFLVISSFASFAQDKKTQAFYDNGMTEFKNKNYSKAIFNLTKFLEKDSTNLEVFLRLAQMYDFQKNQVKATENYTKLSILDSTGKSYPQAFTYLGSKALEKSNFVLAKFYLTKSIANTNKNSIIYQQLQKQIKICDFGIEALKHPLNIKPEPLPKVINARQKQYFPVLTADNATIFFTADDDNGDENMYYSVFKNNQWQSPSGISKNINTANNEGTCSISADGKILVFTACERQGGFGSCDLYISKKQGEEWSMPENLGSKVNSPFWDSQPSLSADGSKIFFSSERPYGIGKKDIWMTELDDKNNWKQAINLGALINTHDDEVSPFIHANGYSLFFASNGKIGMGNFDIFMCTFKNSIANEPVLNLGYPINTMNDENSLFITADGKKAYYTVDENNNAKLYSFEIPTEMSNKFDKAFYLKGFILDSKTQKPLYSSIELLRAETNEKISKFQSDPITGDYMAILPGNGKYIMYIETPNYLFKSVNLDFSVDKGSSQMDIKMTKIEKEAVGVLNNIFFDSGSSTLRVASFVELDRLLKLLLINPDLKIEISGHTDDIGNEAFNLDLSRKRALAVTNYLYEKGIDKTRIVSKGYGKSKPLAKNDNETNRQLNRRIEFKFL